MPEPQINNQYEALIAPEATAATLVEILSRAPEFPISEGELSIAFVDDASIAKIHGDYMEDPTPTDVITFPADAAMESAGEIIVSVDHARSRSAELGEPFSRELSLYLIHGWLHLAGYDDRNDSDRADMRVAEQLALRLLDQAPETVEFLLAE